MPKEPIQLPERSTESAEPGAKPVSAEPGAGPVSAEPGAKPVSAEPGAKPVSTEPGTKPVSTEPGTKPVSTEPGAKPISAEPGAKPVSTEPGAKPVSTEPVAGPVEPVASALTAQEKAYPSFTVPGAVAAIAGGYHSTPFDILGIHPHTVEGKPAIVIRTFQPQALTVSVLRGYQAYPMRRVHQDGFFEAVFHQSEFFHYRLSITLPALDGGRQTYEIDDPYRYPPVLTDFDLHLLGEGTHFRLYEKLGARILEHAGSKGVCFAVWAPNAERVSVVGNFNQWDGRRHPMRPRGASGLWEIFIPGLKQGELYKFEVKSRHHGYLALKSDPYAHLSEMRPNTSSVIWDLNRYEWSDQEWMAARKRAAEA